MFKTQGLKRKVYAQKSLSYSLKIAQVGQLFSPLGYEVSMGSREKLVIQAGESSSGLVVAPRILLGAWPR
jgi:hypothetical protein